jgi:negative regulator of flagellin synthesis FlgM
VALDTSIVQAEALIRPGWAEGSTRISTMSADESHDIDSAKVESIRDAIRDGRLEIRADRIADGLMANLRDTQE